MEINIFDNGVLKVILNNGCFFYCDATLRDYICSASAISLSQSSGYPVVNGTLLHHTVMLDALANAHDNKTIIDHINGLTFDACSSNLQLVTSQENSTSRPLNVINYRSTRNGAPFYFEYKNNSLDLSFVQSFHTELDALRGRNLFEKALSESYNCIFYSFIKDRRRDIDLLCDLREGRLAYKEEEELYVKRYANNPWYFYRYYNELKDYDYLFDLNSYIIDSNGFIADERGVLYNPFIIDPIKSKLSYPHISLELVSTETESLHRKLNNLKELQQGYRGSIDKELYKMGFVELSLVRQALDKPTLTKHDLEDMYRDRISNEFDIDIDSFIE